LLWKFTNDRPIYLQIVEAIQVGIVSGFYPSGSGVPSVRTLALEAEVNPNTMQRALQELESIGLLHTQRTAGRTVTEDREAIEKLREKLAEDHITAFFAGMRSIGIDKDEAVKILSKAAKRADTADAADAADAANVPGIAGDQATATVPKEVN
jgi:DNA-binding transcriptional regulator YhcF (GntR family)